MEQQTGPIFGNFGEQFKIYDSAKSWNIPYSLGQELWLPDGRRFRFGRNGAVAAVPGRLYQSEVPDGDHDTLAVPTSTLNVIGSRSLRLTNGVDVIEANLYKDGYAVCEAAAGAGDGFFYKIGSHGELAASVDVTIPLIGGEGLQTALNTSDTITLVKHPGADVIIHPAPPTAKLYGVAAAALPAADYGWFQYQGPCACLVVGTHVIGGGIVATGTVTGSPDGSVEAAGTIITTTAATIAQITELLGAYIGVCMEVAPTTGLGMVMLNIA